MKKYIKKRSKEFILIFILLFIFSASFVSAGFFDWLSGFVTENYCNDSDRGRDYYIKGTITFDTRKATDFCRDPNVLNEYFCHDEKFNADNYICPNGCQDGACIQEEPICVDLCGDNICQREVCLGSGCPCVESEKTCPQDCKVDECNTDMDCVGVDIACPLVVGGDRPKCDLKTNICYCGGVCGDGYCDSVERRDGTCTEDCAEEICPAVYNPVCGVDNRTYLNSCEAGLQGISIACQGECPCVEEECIDFDGRDQYTTGNVTYRLMDGRMRTVYDFCRNEFTLNEYFCFNGKLEGDNVRCDNGCKDGFCIRNPTPPIPRGFYVNKLINLNSYLDASRNKFFRWYLYEDEEDLVESFYLFWREEGGFNWRILKSNIPKDETSIVLTLPDAMMIPGNYEVAVRSYSSRTEMPFSDLYKVVDNGENIPPNIPRFQNISAVREIIVVNNKNIEDVDYEENILIAIDEEYIRINPNWEQDAQILIDNTNAIFVKNTRKKYKIVKFMTFPHGERSDELIKNVDYQIRDENYFGTTIFIKYNEESLASGDNARYFFPDGQSLSFISLFIPRIENLTTLNAAIVLTHELGHSFGIGIREWYNQYKAKDITGIKPNIGSYFYRRDFDPMDNGDRFTLLNSYIINGNANHNLVEITDTLRAKKQMIRVITEDGNVVPNTEIRIFDIEGNFRKNANTNMNGLADISDILHASVILLKASKDNSFGARFISYIDQMERRVLYGESEISIYDVVITPNDKFKKPLDAEYFKAIKYIINLRNPEPITFYWTNPIIQAYFIPHPTNTSLEILRIQFREKGTQIWHTLEPEYGFYSDRLLGYSERLEFTIAKNFFNDIRDIIVPGEGKIYEFRHQYSNNSIIEGDWSDGKVIEIITRDIVELEVEVEEAIRPLEVGCIPEWRCRLEPTYCPENGVQIRTCRDVACDKEPFTTEVRCTLGECEGCLLDDECVDFGFRATINDVKSYCDISKEFRPQKFNLRSCDNNYECISNLCSNGRCTDIFRELRERSLIERSLEFLRRIWPFYQ